MLTSNGWRAWVVFDGKHNNITWCCWANSIALMDMCAGKLSMMRSNGQVILAVSTRNRFWNHSAKRSSLIHPLLLQAYWPRSGPCWHHNWLTFWAAQIVNGGKQIPAALLQTTTVVNALLLPPLSSYTFCLSVNTHTHSA